MYSRAVFVRSGEGKSCLEKWRGEKRIEREVRSIEFGDGAPPSFFESFSRVCGSCAPRHRVEAGVGDCEWDDDADGDDARRTRERGRAERSQSGRARLRSLSTAGLTSFSSRRRDGRSNRQPRSPLLHPSFSILRHLRRTPPKLFLLRFLYFACDENRSIKIGNRWNRDKDPVCIDGTKLNESDIEEV